MADVNKTVRDNIRKFRLAKGLTQEKLAYSAKSSSSSKLISTQFLPKTIMLEAESTIPDDWGWNEGQGEILWELKKIKTKDMIDIIYGDGLEYCEDFERKSEILAEKIQRSCRITPIVIGPAGIEGKPLVSNC